MKYAAVLLLIMCVGCEPNQNRYDVTSGGKTYKNLIKYAYNDGRLEWEDQSGKCYQFSEFSYQKSVCVEKE